MGCQATRGILSLGEQELYINVLELTAILFSLLVFEHEPEGRPVIVFVLFFVIIPLSINYVIEMRGTTSKSCNDVSTLIWGWCLDHSSWFPCSHLPG